MATQVVKPLTVRIEVPNRTIYEQILLLLTPEQRGEVLMQAAKDAAERVLNSQSQVLANRPDDAVWGEVVKEYLALNGFKNSLFGKSGRYEKLKKALKDELVARGGDGAFIDTCEGVLMGSWVEKDGYQVNPFSYLDILKR